MPSSHTYLMCWFCMFVCLKTGSLYYVAMAVLELTWRPGPLELRDSPCLCLLGSGIKGVCHHTLFDVFEVWGLLVYRWLAWTFGIPPTSVLGHKCAHQNPFLLFGIFFFSWDRSLSVIQAGQIYEAPPTSAFQVPHPFGLLTQLIDSDTKLTANWLHSYY